LSKVSGCSHAESPKHVHGCVLRVDLHL